MKSKIFLLMMIVSTLLQAQNFDAAGLGFARNYLTMSHGLDAFSRNPANLAYETPYKISIRVPALNISLSNNALSFADYERYLTLKGNGGEWSEQDVDNFLALIPDDGLRINANVGVGLFAMKLDQLAFGLGVVAEGNINARVKRLLGYALKDLNLTRDFSFRENELSAGGGYSAIKFSAAYGHLLDFKYRAWDLDDVAVGVRFNGLLGLAVADIQQASALVERGANGSNLEDEYLALRGEVRARVATPQEQIPGKGYSLDFSASARWKKEWHFSLLMENAIGGINWSGVTQEFMFVQQDTLFANGDSTLNPVNVDTLRDIDGFRTPLPTNLIFGASYRFSDELTFAAQWRQGVTGEFGNVRTPEVGLAVAYSPFSLLTLRSGMTFGGRDVFLFALGVGAHLGPLQLDAAYASRQSLWPGSSNGAVFSFAMTLGI